MQINEVLTSAYKLKWGTPQIQNPNNCNNFAFIQNLFTIPAIAAPTMKSLLFAYGSPEGEHAYKTKKCVLHEHPRSILCRWCNSYSIDITHRVMRKSSIIVIIQEIPVVRLITPNHEDISSSLQELDGQFMRCRPRVRKYDPWGISCPGLGTNGERGSCWKYALVAIIPCSR
jgi:hypothetical protein